MAHNSRGRSTRRRAPPIDRPCIVTGRSATILIAESASTLSTCCARIHAPKTRHLRAGSGDDGRSIRSLSMPITVLLISSDFPRGCQRLFLALFVVSHRWRACVLHCGCVGWGCFHVVLLVRVHGTINDIGSLWRVEHGARASVSCFVLLCSLVLLRLRVFSGLGCAAEHDGLLDCALSTGIASVCVALEV
jgi:hypothetical protein